MKHYQFRDLPNDVQKDILRIGKSCVDVYEKRRKKITKRNMKVVKLFLKLSKKHPVVCGGRRPDGQPGGRKWCWDKIQAKFPGINIPLIKTIIQNYKREKLK